MKFYEVLKLLETSDIVLVRRASWRSDKRVRRVFPEGKLSYLEIDTREGIAPYAPSQCDMIADDWESALVFADDIATCVSAVENLPQSEPFETIRRGVQSLLRRNRELVMKLKENGIE